MPHGSITADTERDGIWRRKHRQSYWEKLAADRQKNSRHGHRRHPSYANRENEEEHRNVPEQHGYDEIFNPTTPQQFSVFPLYHEVAGHPSSRPPHETRHPGHPCSQSTEIPLEYQQAPVAPSIINPGNSTEAVHDWQSFVNSSMGSQNIPADPPQSCLPCGGGAGNPSTNCPEQMFASDLQHQGLNEEQIRDFLSSSYSETNSSSSSGLPQQTPDTSPINEPSPSVKHSSPREPSRTPRPLCYRHLTVKRVAPRSPSPEARSPPRRPGSSARSVRDHVGSRTTDLRRETSPIPGRASPVQDFASREPDRTSRLYGYRHVPAHYVATRPLSPEAPSSPRRSVQTNRPVREYIGSSSSTRRPTERRESMPFENEEVRRWPVHDSQRRENDDDRRTSRDPLPASYESVSDEGEVEHSPRRTVQHYEACRPENVARTSMVPPSASHELVSFNEEDNFLNTAYDLPKLRQQTVSSLLIPMSAYIYWSPTSPRPSQEYYLPSRDRQTAIPETGSSPVPTSDSPTIASRQSQAPQPSNRPRTPALEESASSTTAWGSQEQEASSSSNTESERSYSPPTRRAQTPHPSDRESGWYRADGNLQSPTTTSEPRQRSPPVSPPRHPSTPHPARHSIAPRGAETEHKSSAAAWESRQQSRTRSPKPPRRSSSSTFTFPAAIGRMPSPHHSDLVREGTTAQGDAHETQPHRRRVSFSDPLAEVRRFRNGDEPEVVNGTSGYAADR